MRVLRRVVAADDLAAQSTAAKGTLYHKVELDDAIEILQRAKANLFLLHQLETDGWDALDMKKSMFGSFADGDTLYICETDGKDIMVKGEEVDPESAMSDYTLEELSAYIVEADKQIVQRFVTEYELADFDIDEAAAEMLRDGKPFLDMMADAQTLPQITK